MNLINKLKSLDKGTIFRTVMQFLAYVNQVVAVIGNTSFASAMWYQIVTVVLTIVTTAVSYWYNNDWTNFAHLSSDIFDMLEDGQITEEELNEFMAKHKKQNINKEVKQPMEKEVTIEFKNAQAAAPVEATIDGDFSGGGFELIESSQLLEFAGQYADACHIADYYGIKIGNMIIASFKIVHDAPILLGVDLRIKEEYAPSYPFVYITGNTYQHSSGRVIYNVEERKLFGGNVEKGSAGGEVISFMYHL